LNALSFAAQRHSGHLRKDSGPFINHPIAVAELLARVGRVADVILLQAAVLHDVLEDTPTVPDELRDRFGQEVLSIVLEVTDDERLPKAERKRLQVENAPRLSLSAKQIRIADKICNVNDLTHSQPEGWSLERKREYLDWAEQVVACCRGCNPALERHFDDLLQAKRRALGGRTAG
jgi:(p)ppGpp synthase/HD superfamily hydrolase